MAVGIGCIVQAPSPATTLSELSHSPAENSFASLLVESVAQKPGSGWPGAPGSILHAQVTTEIHLMQAYAKSHGGGSVGYLGPNSNYLVLSNGIQSRMLYDDAADFTLGPTHPYRYRGNYPARSLNTLALSTRRHPVHLAEGLMLRRVSLAQLISV